MTRYDRQTRLPEIGPDGQDRLRKAHVLVAGAGGLAAPLLPLLAGAGIGRITLFDGDVVEAHNLHRQTLFRMTDIGAPKVSSAARELTALNPECRVVARAEHLTPANARTAIEGVDLVIDAADRFTLTYLLSDLCHAAGLPMISASVLGRRGHVGGFCGAAPSYRAMFPDLPGGAQSCATAGVMGPAVAVMGSLQAQMAMAVLLGLKPSPLGLMMTVDLADWQVTRFRFDNAPEPTGRHPVLLSRLDLRTDDEVIDLRDIAEAPVMAVPQAIRLAPEDVAGLIPQGRRTIFACATGLRAWAAARKLTDRGLRAAVLVDGD